MMQLSTEYSKLMFCSIIVLAPFILQLCKYAKTNVTRDIFIIISFLMVFIPLGFRSVGIDYDVYKSWYEQPSLVLENPFTPEPLYAALSLFASYIHCFQICYIIPAFLFTLGLFYYTLKKSDDFFCTSLTVLMSIYIYMCGVTRFSAALGLLWIAFANFDNGKKCIIITIIATLFHYAAVIGILIFFIYRSNRAISVKNCLFFVTGLFAVIWLVQRFGNDLYVFKRVSHYLNFTFDLSALKNVILVFPTYILMLLYYPAMKQLYEDSVQLKNILILLLAFIAISVVMPGTFRLCWPFLIFIGDIYGRIPRVIMIDEDALVIMIIYKIIFAVVAVTYQYVVFFDSPYIANLVIPFEFTF